MPAAPSARASALPGRPPSVVHTSAAAPLADEQVRRYVADGFVVLDSGLDAGFHAAVADELRYCMKHERPLPGDNLLPRIPALGELLAAPPVHGAVASVLGPAFAWAPHRFPHNSEPLADPPARFDPFENGARMGEGSLAASGWHQDGHSRAGRVRWHTFRAANLFYFPHETPLAMGPTRLLAGTHLYANLHGIKREQVFMEAMPAGTVVLADFDVAHAGAPNRTADSRYMLKFVALRQQNPTAPSWDSQASGWRPPDRLRTPHDVPLAWRSLWNWLRGAPRGEGILARAAGGDAPQLAKALRTADQQQRLAALYGLAALGEPAVDALVAMLLDAAGKGRHVSPPPTDPAFYGMAKDPRERRFTNRQCVPEDAAVALGAIGEPAAPRLLELLRHEDAWVRINAAYALGETGAPAADLADAIGELLDDSADSVVRAALDALCALPTFGAGTVARIHRLLTTDVAAWQTPAMGEHWHVQDQVRYAACWALVARASGEDAPTGLEAALRAALDDHTGYVPATACEGLLRLGTPTALAAAVRHLQNRRWDTLHHRFARAKAAN